MTDIDDMVVGDNDDEMMELWWGDEARKGGEIRTYVMDDEDTEVVIAAKLLMTSSIPRSNRLKTGPMLLLAPKNSLCSPLVV